MFRKLAGWILVVFLLGALAGPIDWFWFHGLRTCFEFLEVGAGYWTLVFLSVEVYLTLIICWKSTRSHLAYQWLMRASSLLPSYLFVAYFCQSLSTDPRSVHSLETFYSWQTAMILRSQEIHAARAIPILTAILVFLYVGGRCKKSQLVARTALVRGSDLRCVGPNKDAALRCAAKP